MNALASFGKTAAVLISLWVALALVGLITRVVPPREGLGAELAIQWFGDAPEEPDADTSLDGSVADGGDVDGSQAEDAAQGRLDAGAPPAIEPPAIEPPPRAPGPALARHRVCAEPAGAPSLAVIDALGDERTEIVVGCGSEWQIFGRTAEGALMRVARITPPAAPLERTGLASAAIALDIDGDGRLDLALPYARVGPGGATSGGGLFVLARRPSGAPGDARSLAPIAAVALAPIVLPTGPGLVALDRANPFARLPSEAWVFGLGAAPARIASVRAGTGATGLAVVDLDRDGMLDVVVASSDDSRVDILYGDSLARFTRRRTLSVPSAAALSVGDVDGDGAPDVVVQGAGLTRILARTGDPVAEPIVGAPPDLRDVEIVDTDGDGRPEIVGWSHPRLTVLAPRADGTYEAQTLAELGEGEVGPRRQLLVDLNGDGAREIVLLVVGTDGAERSLDLVIVPSTERGTIRTEAARPIPDAPLALTIVLPDPNAP